MISDTRTENLWVLSSSFSGVTNLTGELVNLMGLFSNQAAAEQEASDCLDGRVEEI